MLTVIAAVVGCGSSGGQTPVTLTETVTVSSGSGSGSASGAAGQTGTPGAGGDSGTSTTAGAPITVVDPSAVGSGGGSGADTASSGTAASGAGQQPSADNPDGTQGTDNPSEAPATTAVTTTSTPATTSPESRAAARMVAARCSTMLSASDIAGALGKSLGSTTIRVEDVANPDNKMTARTKCYYGTADIGAARPLVVAIAGFTDADAAGRQRDVTLQSEKAAGAKTSNADLGSGDGQIKIMLRDGGLAVTQAGAATISIAIDRGVVADSALRSALTLLTRSVLNHVQ